MWIIYLDLQLLMGCERVDRGAQQLRSMPGAERGKRQCHGFHVPQVAISRVDLDLEAGLFAWACSAHDGEAMASRSVLDIPETHIGRVKNTSGLVSLNLCWDPPFEWAQEIDARLEEHLAGFPLPSGGCPEQVESQWGRLVCLWKRCRPR